MEMPEVAHPPNVLPSSDARQERIHQNVLADLGWILGRIGIGHHQADVVPDDPHVIKAELVHKLPNVLCYGLLVVATMGALRVTGAAQIGSDHGAALSERR